ncbi:ankyrin [Mollisia scopiformis]|uniref:Ankyrin n=1 Tax=Mollisia scopiformis TaxID=149040 RepID=A0A132BDE8_MOLSC|nr:ankyrin [Mollisia scopiformis]KUJ10009.1 ankyrin [Mollisia scopiformis]
MSSSDSDEFEVIDQLEASLSPKELAKVQAWLEPTDYNAQSSEFHRHLSSQAPGTGLWICETSKYQQWEKSTEYGSLWIKGVPGSGKSVTAASIVEHLQEKSNTPILYFFFRYIISANKRPRSLVKDYLAQLLPFSIRLQATLESLTTTDLDDFSDERLWEYLLIGLTSVENAYCVVDALDEMELLPNDSFLSRLNNLATFRPNNVKLIVTSRPEQYLQKSLNDTSIVHISLEEDLVGKDIILFLSHRLQSLISQSDQQSLRDSLVSAISERSNGLFLYARLLLDQIAPHLGSTQVDVNELVKNIPISLEDMYNSMLFHNATSLKIDIEIQMFILELATHASRALRLNELASALASAFPTSMIPMAPKLLTRSACAPLLEILEDETVQVIHHSFTEFLLNEERSLDEENSGPQFPVLNTSHVHRKLTIVCLDHLQSGGLRLEKQTLETGKGTATKQRRGRRFPEENTVDRENYQEAKLFNPFLEYAVENWAFHASKYDFEDDGFFQSIEKFLNHDSIDFKKWLKLEWIAGTEDCAAPAPLHVAAFSGLTAYAKKLLGGTAVDIRDGEDRTPLHWACARGHVSMVSLLLGNGATPDPEDCRGVKPIHEAARKNYASIVKALLDAGVDPLSPKEKENVSRRLVCGDVSTKGETAVEYVCLQGHTDTAKIMLPFLSSAATEEMFCQCCRHGKYEVARAILNATKVSPNSKSSGATALYLACQSHSVPLVRMLLENGADVHQTSRWKYKTRQSCGRRVVEEPLRTPIHAVLYKWDTANNTACQNILRLLLDAGADIEARDGNGDTPLLSIFGHRRRTSFEIAALTSLLESGSDVLAIDSKGDSVLHRFLDSSHDIQSLKMLFQHGARGDVIGKDGDTILHTALHPTSRDGSSRYTLDLVKILLDMKARCDVKNEHGSTALEVAAGTRGCGLEMVKTLLQACSDKDIIQRCLWHVSTRKTKEETVELIRTLQKFGVSLEDRNDKGETVLLAQVAWEELFDAFVECGADWKAIDSRGRGVLHHYTLNCHNNSTPQRLQRLEGMVDMGLDPLQVDHDGNTLLHVRAAIYKGEELDRLLVQKLLDFEVSGNAKNNKGMTPLHVYFENWDFHRPTTTVRKALNERFHEHFKISLLEIFKRNPEVVDINAQDAEGVTLLHLAAMRSEARLFYLLEEGADPSILTKDGRNALHLACRAREGNVVEYLSHNFMTMINQRDIHGRTPLHDACASGLLESVRSLLKAGADITAVDNNKRTPLHACAEYADEEKLWSLLARHNKESSYCLRDRFRPARSTPPSYQQWHEIPRRGPTKTLCSSTTTSTEQYSFNIGHIVKALLSAGSATEATRQNIHNQTPLDMAIEYDCKEMVQALESSIVQVQDYRKLEVGDRRLETLAALRRPMSVRELDESACQEILQNPSFYLPYLTPSNVEWTLQQCREPTGAGEPTSALSTLLPFLCVAVASGFAESVESCGSLARINDDPKAVLARIQDEAKVPEEYSPIYSTPMLNIACSRKLPNMDTIKVLIEKCGVDVNARALVKSREWANPVDSIEGGTSLHVLAKAHCWWQLEALNYLVQNGANIEAVNEKGETPLHVACTGPTYVDMNCTNAIYGYWRIEFVNALLELGADVNALDNSGLSCLHKASSSPTIMKILLKQGADPTAGSTSPIFSAIQIQCLETLSTLLDAGISPNAIDTSAESEGFKLHYLVKNQSRSALFCTAFASLHNQRPKHSSPVAKLLIERGADIYHRLDDTDTLIHYFFENAEYELVCAFLDHASKIDFDTRDSQGRTVFLAACDWKLCLPFEHHDWEFKAVTPFLTILEFGADLFAVDNDGRNALHHLLDNPDIEEPAIKQFLAHDAAKTMLHQKDNKGFTPLHCALRTLRPAIVEVLLYMGANLQSPDPNGATALHHIAAQCLQVKRPSKKTWSGAHEPEYYSGLLALWKKYLAMGGSINVRDNAGSPPLFWYMSSSQRDDYNAAKDGCCHMEHFDTYFFEDVNLNARNNNGENVLHIIAKREKNSWTKPEHDKQLYAFPVRKGISPLDEDGKGRSSLDIAAACEQKGILELFQHKKESVRNSGHTHSH